MFVADLHNDVLQRAFVGEDISKLTLNGHSDLIRLKDSCIDLEVFVIWIAGKNFRNNAFEQANKFYDKLEELERQNSFIKIPKNLKEIEENYSNDVLSSPLSIEGGEPIEEDIEKLYHFIQRGLFYFGPTWNRSLSWVSSNYDET